MPPVWLGVLLCVAFVAAPAPFALLAPADAGRVNGRVFLQEAWISVALALLLWLFERARAQRAAASGKGSTLSTEMILLLGTLLCTLGGYFAVQTQLPAARAGLTMLSFAQLHGASMALFGIKLLLVAALAWRSTAA
ncbi:MAG: DUF4149 domain-containing protein [Rubrivivax sp.]|nr:DUF4149 domain-containing protein [Rubrivivax sp.]